MISLKPINFVTGKGGVGKSVIAAALAHAESLKGKKVLLVELGEKSFFEKFFQSSNISYEPQKITENLSVSCWSYRACLREYVGFYIKSGKIYDIFFENNVMQKFIQAAPALKELAILGKATSQPRKVGPPMGFDCIIIDSYSMGHHLALLKAPEAMSQAIRQGPMGYHSQKIFDIIRDPQWCQHIIVLKPEDLPTIEGLELYNKLKEKWNIESELILNQFINFPISHQELEGLSQNASSLELQKICYEFLQLETEQMTCLKKIKKHKEHFFVTPFYFEKENPMHFLNQIQTGTSLYEPHSH